MHSPLPLLLLLLLPLPTLATDHCPLAQATKARDSRRRFRPTDVARICRLQTTWTRQAQNDTLKHAVSLTPPQERYLDKIRTCSSLKCICEEHPESLQCQGLHRIWVSLSVGRRRKRQLNFVNDMRDGLGRAERKEYRALSDQERDAFHRAMNRLKTDLIDGMSKYDLLIVYHTPERSPGAHFGPALLPFHRELLRQLEIGLRQVDPDVALPYWNPSLDSSLPDPAQSILWTSLYFGNGDGEVVTGPYADWRTIPDAVIPDMSSDRRIVRNIGHVGSLYSQDDLQRVMNRRSMRELSFCQDVFFEMVHGDVHRWVGGHMVQMRVSPNDPTFFLLHSFVDYLWENIREKYQSREERERDYVPDHEACNTYHMADAIMEPFAIRNRDGLSNRYTDVFYTYAPSPTCSIARPDCGAEALFCHTRAWPHPRCMSTIRTGGRCDGLEDLRPCYHVLPS